MILRSLVPPAAGAAVVLLVFAGPGCTKHEHHNPVVSTGALPIGNTHPGFCQVTGETVDVAKATESPVLHSDHEGKRYLFCCKDCKPDFDKDPAKYLKSPPAPRKDGGPAGQDHDKKD